MPEETSQATVNSNAKKNLLFFTLILMGHTTTAPWNSFINNEEYFKWKLEGSKPFVPKEVKTNTNNTGLLRCCIDTIASKGTAKDEYQYCHGENMPDFDSFSKLPNAFETDADYENVVACVQWTEQTSHTTNKTDSVEYDFATFWGSSLSVVALTMTFLSVIAGSAIMKYTSNNLRIFATLILCVVVFLATILMGWGVDDVLQFFSLTMVTVVVVIFASGIAQSSFFAELGPLPPNYIVTLMEGQGLGGVYIALFVICLNYVFKEQGVYRSEFAIKCFMSIFFFQAVLTTLGCLYMFKNVFQKSDEYKENLQKSRQSTASDSEKVDLVKTETNRTIPVMYILKQIWVQLLSVFTTFFICLSLFPACLTNIRQGAVDAFGIKTVNWTFIHYSVFLVFNVGDWLGKKAGNWRYDFKRQNLTLGLTFSRLAFYYLFYLCNPAGTRTWNDGWIFIIVNAVFSLTNGYFGSMIMAQAGQIFAHRAKSLYNEQEIKNAQRQVGPFMVIGLVGGLLAGAAFSNFTSRFWDNEFVGKVQFDFQKAKIDSIWNDL